MKPSALWRALLFATILTITTQAHPQGCAQCQDNTASTPAATQRAYRHAILFMTIAAGSLFLGTLILLKRHR